MGEKQLFVDSVMIREKRDVTRVIHPAKKLEHPVLSAEMPWEWREENGIVNKRVNIYGTVLRDAETGAFQMRYADAGHVLYATSTDGIRWERPILNVAGQNNCTNLVLHSPSIIRDSFEKEPGKRYKAVGDKSMGVDAARLQRLKDKFELVDWYRDKTQRLYYAAYSRRWPALDGRAGADPARLRHDHAGAGSGDRGIPRLSQTAGRSAGCGHSAGVSLHQQRHGTLVRAAAGHGRG